MKFLQALLHTKAPSKDKLLDIAIILSIIPHLFVAKFFVLLYIAIALLFILKNISRQYLLMSIGIILIALSFFSSYNFSNFSKIQFFVSLVSSLLIFAVTLQKLTKEVNVYLKLSPILLMVLSFFFYNSILMLFYSIATLFVFTLLFIWYQMDAEFLDVIKFTAKLFLLSLPLVTLLFLVFPRISIEKTDFGFRADRYLDSGYDGEMRVTSNAITLSNKIVMEVLFEDANMSNSELYFRGSTLTKQEGMEWKKNTKYLSKETLQNISAIKEYQVSIYPHAQKWLYALEMPLATPNNSSLANDYTLSTNKPLYAKKKFRLKSALHYKLTATNLEKALIVDTKNSPILTKRLKSLRNSSKPAQAKAQKLLQFFRDQNISYTLKPTKLKLENFIDSFLFESKNGYCVHFASAFASSARVIGIPSRVVTGFKADKKNMINNYLLVYSSDAHAWVELYFEEDGWVRFDPTTTASTNLSTQEFQESNQLLGSSYFTKLNHYYLYSKYLINNWILDYDRTKQLAILNKLLNDTIYLFKFIFTLLLLIVISYIIFISIKTNRCKERVLCEIQTLLSALKKHGFTKYENQSMHQFFMQIEQNSEIELKHLDKLYHQLKYKKSFDEKLFQEYKKEIQRVKNKL